MGNGPGQFCSCVLEDFLPQQWKNCLLVAVLHSQKSAFFFLSFFFPPSLSKSSNSLVFSQSYKSFTNPREKLLLLYLRQLASKPHKTTHESICFSSSPDGIHWPANLSSLQQPRQHNCTSTEFITLLLPWPQLTSAFLLPPCFVHGVLKPSSYRVPLA